MSEPTEVQTNNPAPAVGPDGFLTADAVVALQRRFLQRIETRVEQAMARLDLDDALLRAAAIDCLLCADRCNAPIGTEQLDYLLTEGVEALEEREDTILEQAEKFAFPLQVRADIDAAALMRAEDHAIENTFKGRERLYMPFDDDVQLESHTMIGVESVLRNRGYTLTDYKGGYATDAEGKQTYKIGRLLQQFGADILLKSFMEDATRHDTQKFLVVLTRNIGDIERMSTNRSWRSCMSHDNEAVTVLHKEISSGTLAAYLVSESDPEINRPFGRILLKPYLRDEMPLSQNFFTVVKGLMTPKQGPEILYVPDKRFGLENKDFENAVLKLSQKLNAGKSGTFTMSPDVYAENKIWPTVTYSTEGVEIVKSTKRLDF